VKMACRTVFMAMACLFLEGAEAWSLLRISLPSWTEHGRQACTADGRHQGWGNQRSGMMPLGSWARRGGRTIRMSGDAEIEREVWMIEKPGNLKHLQKKKDMLPPPGPDEVRVRVCAIGLNFADVFTVLGMYDAASSKENLVPGLEFSGVVEAIGDRLQNRKSAIVSRSPDGKRNVLVSSPEPSQTKEGDGQKIRVGDRVMGFSRFGSFSTHLNVGSSYIRPIPDDWTFQQGASFVVQGLTAWYGLVELGQAQAGKRVLIHSAAGGVGLFCLQICRLFDMTPVAIVGSEEKSALLAETYGLEKSQIVIRKQSPRRFKEDVIGACQLLDGK